MTPWSAPFIAATALAVAGSVAVSVIERAHRRHQDRWLRQLDHDIAERRQVGDALGGDR